MISKQENIKRVVQEYFQDKPVNRIYLFGSHARGDAKEESDVDLIIEIDDSKKRLSMFDFLRLKLGIENSLIKKLIWLNHIYFSQG